MAEGTSLIGCATNKRTECQAESFKGNASNSPGYLKYCDRYSRGVQAQEKVKRALFQVSVRISDVSESRACGEVQLRLADGSFACRVRVILKTIHIHEDLHMYR